MHREVSGARVHTCNPAALVVTLPPHLDACNGGIVASPLRLATGYVTAAPSRAADKLHWRCPARSRSAITGGVLPPHQRSVIGWNRNGERTADGKAGPADTSEDAHGLLLFTLAWPVVTRGLNETDDPELADLTDRLLRGRDALYIPPQRSFPRASTVPLISRKVTGRLRLIADVSHGDAALEQTDELMIDPNYQPLTSSSLERYWVRTGCIH